MFQMTQQLQELYNSGMAPGLDRIVVLNTICNGVSQLAYELAGDGNTVEEIREKILNLIDLPIIESVQRSRNP